MNAEQAIRFGIGHYLDQARDRWPPRPGRWRQRKAAGLDGDAFVGQLLFRFADPGDLGWV